jgi:hypothetical protein
MPIEFEDIKLMRLRQKLVVAFDRLPKHERPYVTVGRDLGVAVIAGIMLPPDFDVRVDVRFRKEDSDKAICQRMYKVFQAARGCPGLCRGTGPINDKKPGA